MILWLHKGLKNPLAGFWEGKLGIYLIGVGTKFIQKIGRKSKLIKRAMRGVVEVRI